MLDELAADLGNVHQTVLMNADVHKCAEVDDVAHRTLQGHAFLQVLHVQHVLPQQGRGQLVTGVTSGLCQLPQDIPQSRLAHGKLLCQRAQVGRVGLLRQRGVAGLDTQLLQQRLCRLIGFGMDGGVVQRLLAAGNAQEACTLLKGLGAQLGHLFQLGAALKTAVLLPEGHDVLAHGGGQAGNVAQQGGGGGVQVGAHRVDTAFHHAVQRGLQLFGGHIVLILTHADGLGLDFHQLGKGVLQTAGDGHGRAQGQVEVGHLLCRQLGGRVHRRACLGHHHVAHLAGELTEHLDAEQLGLLGGRAVADGDDLHVPLEDFVPQGLGRALFLPFAVGGIDHGGVQHLAGLVHHCQLTAGAVAGVQTDGGLALDGRCHQQLAQVDAEQPDGVLAGLFGELGADFPLDGGVNQTVIGILAGVLHQQSAGGTALHIQAADDIQGAAGVGDHAHLQKALFLAAVEGQHLMACQLFHRVGELVVGGVDAVLLLLGGRGGDGAVDPYQIAHPFAHLGVVGHLLGDDVLCALQSGIDAVHALFGVEEGLCQLCGVFGAFLLEQERLCQRLQTLFLCHAGAGFALGAEGAVDVVDFGQGGGLVQCGADLVGEVALTFDELAHLFPSGVQIAQVFQLVGNLANQLVIHGAVLFLAVAGDEGDGVALVQQGDDICNVVLADRKFLGDHSGVRHDVLLSRVVLSL